MRNFAQRLSSPLQTARCDANADAASGDAAALVAAAAAQPSSFTVYQVLGFRECPWFHRAACVASDLKLQPEWKEQVEVSILPVERSQFGAKLEQVAEVRNTDRRARGQSRSRARTRTNICSNTQHFLPVSLPSLQMLPESASHNSCPAILSTQCHRDETAEVTPDGIRYQCDRPTFIGGYAELVQNLQTKYSFTSKRCEIYQQAMGGANNGRC